MNSKFEKRVKHLWRHLSAPFNVFRVLHNPLFDADWYGGAYLGTSSKIYCAYHYLTHWGKARTPFNPSLKFSTSVYLRDHPETKQCPLLLTRERNVGQDREYTFKAPDTSLIRTEPLKDDVLDQAVILPLMPSVGARGVTGVMDVGGVMHSIYSERNGFPLADKIEGEIVQDDGEVYWGGPLHLHWGHFVVEYASTLWPLLKYKEISDSIRVAFSIGGIPCNTSDDYQHYHSICEFLNLFGLKERQILWITRPTRFSKVHMVEPSSRINEYSTHIYREIFDHVSRDIEPARYDKVYFTRAQGKHYITVRERGEHQLEKSFKKLGYSVFAPEHLSLREQISIIKGAKEYACLSSTLLHHVVFMQPGAKLISCEKYCEPNPCQPFLEAVSKVSSLSLKAYIQFLPVNIGFGPFLVGITEDVQHYFETKGIRLRRKQSLTRLEKAWYLRQWFSTYDPMNINLFDDSFGKVLSQDQLEFLRNYAMHCAY